MSESIQFQNPKLVSLRINLSNILLTLILTEKERVETELDCHCLFRFRCHMQNYQWHSNIKYVEFNRNNILS